MLTETAFILDRSGSMSSMCGAAITGFNSFLNDQQSAAGVANFARMTLVLFDNEILTVHDAVPVAEIAPLNDKTYVPRASTALLDAIGDTIDRMGRRFAALPEAERPGHVAIAILTDGEENSSVRFTWKEIAARIKHQTEKYSWDFLFLGAGQDAIATASKLNIAAGNSALYAADDIGHLSASRTISRKVSGLRQSKIGHATEEEREDAQADLCTILEEEDQKRRKGKKQDGPVSLAEKRGKDEV